MPLAVAMALSGLSVEHWDGSLKKMYEQGARALHDEFTKETDNSPMDSRKSPDASSESGISSLSPASSEGAPAQDIGALYLQIISKLEAVIKDKQKFEEKPKKQDRPLITKRIMHEDRDILDLGANVRGSWPCKSAVLPMGTIDNFYFNNRSQYSRIASVRPPPNVTTSCDICGFDKILYFD